MLKSLNKSKPTRNKVFSFCCRFGSYCWHQVLNVPQKISSEPRELLQSVKAIWDERWESKKIMANSRIGSISMHWHVICIHYDCFACVLCTFFRVKRFRKSKWRSRKMKGKRVNNWTITKKEKQKCLPATAIRDAWETRNKNSETCQHKHRYSLT